MYNKLDPTIQHIFTNVIFINYKCIVIVNKYTITYIFNIYNEINREKKYFYIVTIKFLQKYTLILIRYFLFMKC